MKLLVNAPSGVQELIEIGEGGGYFEVDRVLWDERIDGELPEITIGGMVRQGDALVFDQARMDQTIAASQPTKEEHNAPILAQLAAIDSKSIRALREGAAARITSLEAEAATLRSQLK